MSKTKKAEFRPDDFVVYPTHGVGRIVSIEEQEVAGLRLEMFVISFEKDKMTLRVPIAKASSVGMRALSSTDIVERALHEAGAHAVALQLGRNHGVREGDRAVLHAVGGDCDPAALLQFVAALDIVAVDFVHVRASLERSS